MDSTRGGLGAKERRRSGRGVGHVSPESALLFMDVWNFRFLYIVGYLAPYLHEIKDDQEDIQEDMQEDVQEDVQEDILESRHS